MQVALQTWRFYGPGNQKVIDGMLRVSLGEYARVSVVYAGQLIPCWRASLEFAEQFQKDCRLFGIDCNIYVYTAPGGLTLWMSVPWKVEFFLAEQKFLMAKPRQMS